MATAEKPKTAKPEEPTRSLTEQEKWDAKPYTGYFRVMRGSHTEGPGKGTTYRGERWGRVKESSLAPGEASRERLQGQVVHSKSNLLNLNPAHPEMTKKFVRVEGPDDGPNVTMAGEVVEL